MQHVLLPSVGEQNSLLNYDYMYFYCKISHFARHLNALNRFQRRTTYANYARSLQKMSSMNIVVFTGSEEENLFKNISRNLLRCLNADNYVIYSLRPSQVLTTPWQENIALLLVYSEYIDQNIGNAFSDYLDNHGNILMFCSELNIPDVEFTTRPSSTFGLAVTIKPKQAPEFSLTHGNFKYCAPSSVTVAEDSEGNSTVVKVSMRKGTMVASEVYLALDPSFIPGEKRESTGCLDECQLHMLRNILSDELGMDILSLEMPEPTSGYVLTENEVSLSKLKETMSLSYICISKDPEETKVPLVFTNNLQNSLLFNKDLYFAKLKTNSFGKTVVFFQVVTSTMIPAEHLSNHHGLVVIAGRQISGRGRSDNLWISPEGCAMFTLNLTISLRSTLGQRLSCLQHIASLAAVHGIRKIPHYRKLDLRLKWPNDIYLGRDRKIGGVLVTTTIQGSLAEVHIGVGINTSNHRPTVCLCSAIEELNAEEAVIPLLTVEEVIALTLSEMEHLFNNFMTKGPEDFLALYYSYWIHEGQNVRLEARGEDVKVVGLDEYGFLIVQTRDGKKLTLQPDGNRFDIMKNLIVSK